MWGRLNERGKIPRKGSFLLAVRESHGEFACRARDELEESGGKKDWTSLRRPFSSSPPRCLEYPFLLLLSFRPLFLALSYSLSLSPRELVTLHQSAY